MCLSLRLRYPQVEKCVKHSQGPVHWLVPTHLYLTRCLHGPDSVGLLQQVCSANLTARSMGLIRCLCLDSKKRISRASANLNAVGLIRSPSQFTPTQDSHENDSPTQKHGPRYGPTASEFVLCGSKKWSTMRTSSGEKVVQQSDFCAGLPCLFVHHSMTDLMDHPEIQMKQNLLSIVPALQPHISEPRGKTPGPGQPQR